MNPTLTPSQFTSPDIRLTGTDAVKTAEARARDQEMEEIRVELFAALRHIEELPRRYP